MKILIVDDDATNRKLLRAILEADDHQVVDAFDGLEALNAIDKEPTDAVISDILMPNMDGYRLCQEIRKSDRFRELPFITYTSTYTSPGDEKLAFDCGADKYILKPAPAQVLLDTLQELSGVARVG